MRIEDKSDKNPRVIWSNTIGSLEGPEIFQTREEVNIWEAAYFEA